MSFPVDFMLTPPGVEPAQVRMEETVGRILSQGRGDAYSVIRTPGGGEFGYSEATICLEQLSPDTCVLMFKAAKATHTFLQPGAGHGGPMIVAGVASKPWAVFGTPIEVSSPAQLCAQLQKDMDWQPPANDGLGPKGDYLGVFDWSSKPPPARGNETPLARDPSGVATRCEAKMREELVVMVFRRLRCTRGGTETTRMSVSITTIGLQARTGELLAPYLRPRRAGCCGWCGSRRGNGSAVVVWSRRRDRWSAADIQDPVADRLGDQAYDCDRRGDPRG